MKGPSEKLADLRTAIHKLNLEFGPLVPGNMDSEEDASQTQQAREYYQARREHRLSLERVLKRTVISPDFPFIDDPEVLKAIDPTDLFESHALVVLLSPGVEGAYKLVSESPEEAYRRANANLGRDSRRASERVEDARIVRGSVEEAIEAMLDPQGWRMSHVLRALEADKAAARELYARGEPPTRLRIGRVLSRLRALKEHGKRLGESREGQHGARYRLVEWARGKAKSVAFKDIWRTLLEASDRRASVTDDLRMEDAETDGKTVYFASGQKTDLALHASTARNLLTSIKKKSSEN